MEQTPSQLLKPLLLNEHWITFEEYLAGERTRLVIQLCNCNENQLKELQGQIRALDNILKLKQSLKTEQGNKR